MHIMRYRHCLSKGMSIIKTYFVNEMMNVLIDVRKEILVNIYICNIIIEIKCYYYCKLIKKKFQQY